MSILDELRVLAKYRAHARDTREHLARERAKVEEALRDLILEAEDAVTILRLQEGKVRTLALDAYVETGDKHPCPGVTIKERTVVEYEMGDALGWAKDHRLCLVPESLDVKAFERTITTLPELPMWVTVRTEPIPALAQDLDKALEAT